MNQELVVEIEYVNWRGKQSTRRVVPHAVHFGSSEWRPEPQWLLHAEDLGKCERRDFAMKEIKSWKPVSS